MLAQNYVYEVTADGNSVTVTLSHKTNGDKKEFFLASADPERVAKHMDSLMDDQCDQFFASGKRKKK